MHISIRCFGATAFVTLGAGLATPAIGATVSSSLSVSARVDASCSVSTTALDFGTIDPLSASAVDGTGGVTVTCTNGTAWA
ncbi:MAG: spore coat U domain-containing protein, partial [Pseudomonadota bacterium]|nr:spore coat U domain-containing protein [Pseudomonadota bacterium]